MSQLPLSTGRYAFGDDPEAYAAARPEYPAALYARLTEHCGLHAGTVSFEVGPGTGLATRKLLEAGCAPLHAIEPDARLAAYLRRTVAPGALELHETPFEEVVLPCAHFDFGASAAAFHWLDQAASLEKVRHLLKPGGWWAMWWNTHFGAGENTGDAFDRATVHLFRGIPKSPTMTGQGRPHFALDREARMADLARAGFADAQADSWRWTRAYDTHELVALYSTFSPVKSLAADQRAEFLGRLAEIADGTFGGRVERPFVTALYTARRPSA